MKIKSFKYLLFDCDGVILNSNKIKTDAFGESVIEFGDKSAQELIKYHSERGGISRYKKFEYFIKKNFQENNSRNKKLTIKKLAERYSKIVRGKLEICQSNLDILNYRDKSKAVWFIVTGSDQEELKDILKHRNILTIFDGGVYGSPKSKDEIFSDLIENKKIIPAESIYFGDSKYDYLSAYKFNINFAFLSMWSEFKNIREYAKRNNIEIFNNFNEILKY